MMKMNDTPALPSSGPPIPYHSMLPGTDSTSQNQKRKLSTKVELPAESPAIKRQKLKKRPRRSTPPSFWDNLSRQWLCPSALREFDRRVDEQNNLSQPKDLRPLKVQHPRLEEYQQVKQFARHGGPDLGDLIAYPDPSVKPKSKSSQGRSLSKSQSRSSDMAQSVGPVKRSSAYDAVFEQHLKDCGIYIYHPSQKPKNLQEILKELAMPRSDLSPSNFSDDAFAAFKQANRDAINESTVMTNVFKTIIGSADIPHCVNLQFDGLEPLLKNSVDPFPDFYDGSSPDVLDQHVREKLKNSILPSHNTSAPCLPNFFMEVKGPGGNGRIAERQICYDGAAGARGMHRLRSFIDEKTAIDSRAYTISAVYLSLMGLLTIYTTHPVKSTTSKFEIEYYMTQVRSYILTNSPDSCREGLSALRNARDWAKDRRDELIAAANNKQPPQDSFSSDELA